MSNQESNCSTISQSKKQNPDCCKHVWRNYSHYLTCIKGMNYSAKKCKENKEACKQYERRYKKWESRK
jgi:hypothetical protein